MVTASKRVDAGRGRNSGFSISEREGRGVPEGMTEVV